MSKRILITGASGFVGSFLVEEGLRRQMQVWAGVRKTSSKHYLSDNHILFAELNFASPEILRTQLASYKETMNGTWDYIVHCAGVTKCRKREEFERTNYIGTRNFVEALRDLDMLPQRFVYISTLSIFGPIHEEDYLPIQETDVPKPNTAYGKSKLKAEEYLMSLPAFPYVIFRPTGIYGPRERDYFLMVKSIKHHIDFSVGYKKQLITFIYVKDLVRAVYKSLEKQVVRRTYFLTDGKVYTSRTFSDYIQKELGISWVIRLKCPLFILKIVSLCAESFAGLVGKSSTLNRDKYNIMKQRNWQCDMASTIKDLDFHPEYPLEKGVKEIIAWYKREKWI